MNMNKDILNDILDIPGVYKITNNINGKCYIGQSIFLNRRIKRHLSYKSHKDNLAVYKAFDKYGIDNFSIEILESFNTNDYSFIKKKLDELEIYYIDKFNSYGNGYNKTIGGDAGTTGYRFTEEQKKKVSDNSKLYASNYYKPVYLKSIITKYTKMYISEAHASADLKCHHSQISRTCEWKQMLLNEEWVGGRSYEDLNNRYIQFLNTGKPCRFIRRLTIHEYYDKLKSIKNGDMPTVKQISETLGICKKTISTYNKELLKIGLLEKIKYHKYKLK